MSIPRCFSLSLFIPLLLLFTGCGVQAQTGYLTTKSVKKGIASDFKEINLTYQLGRYEAVLDDLEKITKKAPTFIDAWILLGEARFETKDFSGAEAAYEKAAALDQKYWKPLLRKLATTETRLGKYEEATKHLQAYIDMNPKAASSPKVRKQVRDLAFIQQAKANPVPFSPQRLPATVNTDDPEYLPCLNADGKTLMFTRRVDGKQEDFFVSRRAEDSDWSLARPLTNINTTENEGAQCLSADGRTLVFTICNRKGGAGSCDLWITQAKDGQWQAAKPLPRGINTAEWESQPALSPDGRTLYFARKNTRGQSQSDIYFSQRDLSGKWGTVQALDTTINTPGAETSPFLHADGQTLYFVSDFHPGMGDTDIFVSRRQADGQWGTPQNLGYPINTAQHEGSLVVTLDGRTAYFASNRAELGTTGIGTDLYQLELPEAARATPATYVSGRTFDAGQPNQPGLPAVLTFLDVDSGDTLTTITAHEDGEYLVCLPVGKNYSLTASYPGFLFFSDYFELANNTSTATPFTVDAPLQPIPSPAASTPSSNPIVLRNVFFATGSAALLPASSYELDRLVQTLQDHPEMRIQINGHTDNVGQAEDNQRLSEARATAVMEYLVQAGITNTRLRAKGFGESQPIADNTTPEGRQQNRRTTFVIW